MLFERQLLVAVATTATIGVGYLIPDAFSAALDAAENVADGVGGGLTGHLGLLWRLAGAEVAILLAGFTLAIGVGLRMTFGVMRSMTIAMAGIIPAIAAAVEAALAYAEPALLTPVHDTARAVMKALPREWQIRADVIGAEQMVQLWIIGAIIIAFVGFAAFCARLAHGKQAISRRA